MKTIFEEMGGTYRQEGDYMLPNIEVPESPQIGIWGQRRLQYLRTNKKVLYTTRGESRLKTSSCDQRLWFRIHQLFYYNDGALPAKQA